VQHAIERDCSRVCGRAFAWSFILLNRRTTIDRDNSEIAKLQLKAASQKFVKKTADGTSSE
jgi:hypothetical protein